MKKKQKIKGCAWLCGWKLEVSHAQVLKAAWRLHYVRADSAAAKNLPIQHGLYLCFISLNQSMPIPYEYIEK
jgi:hypothetical protein